jgi:hypothetical protein
MPDSTYQDTSAIQEDSPVKIYRSFCRLRPRCDALGDGPTHLPEDGVKA